MAESTRDGEPKQSLEVKRGVNYPGSESVHCEADSPALKDELGTEEKRNKRSSFMERFSSFRKSNRSARTETEMDDQSTSVKKAQALGDQRQKNLKTAECVQEVTEELVRKTPLSVMQIYELIQSKKLQEAFSSIKLLEDELLAENNSKKYKDDDREYSRKAKDVNMLYNSLFDIMKSIAEDALGEKNGSGQLLASVVEVIQREEIAHNVSGQEAAALKLNGLGTPRKWKARWRESVGEMIERRVHSVSIPLKEDNKSWLSVHLNYLKTKVSDDLLQIKHYMINYYPEDYVANYHRAISSHLQANLLNKTVNFEDLYVLLDWVVNTYCSEYFMGNPALKPEVNVEHLPPLLDPRVLKKLKDDYSTSLTEMMNKYWENILGMEKEKWSTEEEPKRDGVQNEGCYCLPMYIDIQQMIENHVRISEKLCKDLESEALQICLEGLRQFIQSLGKEFMDWDKENASSMFVPYLVIYINSFLELRTDMEKVDALDLKDRTIGTLTNAVRNFKEYFFNRLKLKTQPHFRQLLTKKWISSTEAFDTMRESIRMTSQPLKYLKQPCNKDFVNDVHKYMLKEYIIQIMHQKMRLRRSNRERAVEKMTTEAHEMNHIAMELDSNTEWLFPVIHYISVVIRVKEEEKIKKNLEKLYHEYPDISEEHVLAILNLQGTRRSKKSAIVEHFKTLQKEKAAPGNEGDRVLFAEIEVPSTVKCFSIIS